MKLVILFYVLGGGLVITAGSLASDADFFPDCHGTNYARPTCGGQGPSGEYFSGSKGKY
jgi:hypothetical protein